MIPYFQMKNSYGAILIDTHIALWAAKSKNLGQMTTELLRKTEVIYLSSISLLEIQMKIATNKIPASLDINFLIDQLSLTVLNYSLIHANYYRIFNPDNRDPLDNALIASALCEGVPFITADGDILALQPTQPLILNARE